MTTEQIWLPFGYSIQHRAFRKRLVTSKAAREDAPFNVRSIAAADATPVADFTTLSPKKLAEGERDHGYSHHRSGPTVPHAKLRLFSIDGELYRPALMPDGAEFTIEEFQTTRSVRRTSLAWHFHVDYPLGTDSPFLNPTREEVGDAIYEFHGDDRAEKHLQAAALASRLILVDGLLMKPALMPVLELVPDGSVVENGQRVRGPSLRVIGGGVEAIGDERDSIVFSLDEYDRAVALLDLISEKLGKVPIVDGAVALHTSELARTDVRSFALTRFEASVLRDIGSSAASHSTTTIRHWCDARDRLADFRNGDAPALHAALASAKLAAESATPTIQSMRLLAHTARMETLIQDLVASADLDNQSLAMAL